MSKYTYKVLQGFFKPTRWEEDVQGAFGLQAPPGDWQAFAEAIKELQRQCEPNSSVKVIYLCRHGQALHNQQADEDGLPMELSQKERPTLDAPLTELGRQQALKLRDALQREVKRGMPLPDKWYVSPLQRAGETCQLAWSWLFESGVPATVIENIRERLHVLPCNGRSTVTMLKAILPSFSWPDDMPETDTAHCPEGTREQEDLDEIRARAVKAWEEVMDLAGNATYISMTSHSKLIKALLVALGLEEQGSALASMRVLVLKVSRESSE